MAHPTIARRWTKAPLKPSFSASEIHVWRARLDVAAPALARLRRLLGPEERARARRFIRSIDRRRFVAARGILRSILSRYLRVRPSAIRFRYGPFGKPQLEAPRGATSLSFNLSHSGDRALYAVAARHRIGVDLEHVRTFARFQQLARRHLPAADAQAIDRVPAIRRHAAFFTHWARNEALVKATGEGLRGLRSGAADNFMIVDLRPFRGFAGAVAVHGSPHCVRCWNAHGW